MRSTLDDGLEFTGPTDTFGSAHAFLHSIQGLSQITDDLVIKKIWTDGPDVLVWYDGHAKVAPPSPVAEWHHTSNGKETMVRAVFDAGPAAASRNGRSVFRREVISIVTWQTESAGSIRSRDGTRKHVVR